MLDSLERKSNVLSFVLILMSVVALILYICFVDGIKNVLNIFLNCNKVLLLAGFFSMLLFWGFDYFILNVGLSIFGKKLFFMQGARNCILGQFFNNITPSATGGQPFQAFYMNRYCGIQYGVAIGALLIKFLCYQIALTVSCSLLLFLKYKYFVSRIQGLSFFMFFGFLVISVFATIFIIIGLNKKLTVFLIGFFIKILGKLKIFKETEKKLINVKKEVDLFNEVILSSFRNIGKFLKMVFLSLLKILSLYSVNVIIALVFGINLSLNGVFNVVSGAACVQVTSTFIPLPGAVGGAEFLFLMIYDGVFETNKTSAALLLWRVYTFYFPIIVGLFCSRGLFKRGEIKI